MGVAMSCSLSCSLQSRLVSQYDTGGGEPPRRRRGEGREQGRETGRERGRRRHATKRRGPGPLWVIGSGAVVAVGVLAAVGSLGSGPAPRPPAVDDGGRPGMPALIKQDRAPSPGKEPGTATPSAPPPGATGTARPATARPSATAAVPSSPAAVPPGATATAPATQYPGKSGSAPGIRKKRR